MVIKGERIARVTFICKVGKRDTTLPKVIQSHPSLILAHQKRIQESLEHKEMVIYVFLDIEEAFDNTSHEAIKRALTNKGIDRTPHPDACAKCWLQKLLKERGQELL